MTIHNHGDHVDVTYESTDTYPDPYDIVPQRATSLTSGWSGVAGPTGYGTYAYSNKQYPITSELEWVRMRAYLNPDQYVGITAQKLYW